MKIFSTFLSVTISTEIGNEHSYHLNVDLEKTFLITLAVICRKLMNSQFGCWE